MIEHSWIRYPLSVCSKTLFVKLSYVNKTKNISFYSCKWKKSSQIWSWLHVKHGFSNVVPFATTSRTMFFSDAHMPLAYPRELGIHTITWKHWEYVQLPNACFYTEEWHKKNYPNSVISKNDTFYSFPHFKKNVLYNWPGEHERAWFCSC